MQKYAKVLVDKNALLSVQESISIGKQILQRKLAAYRTKVAKFEELNNMDTVTFSNLFNKGELDDKKEWLKWDHYASAVNLLEKNYLILKVSDMNFELRLKDILIACKIADWYSTDITIDYDLDLSLGILLADVKIVFHNGSISAFIESITSDRFKYRYHYMDTEVI